MLKKFPYVYIHKKCGKPAFYSDHMPAIAEEFLEPKGFFHIDGSPIVAGEPMICDSCLRYIWEFTPDLTGFKDNK